MNVLFTTAVDVPTEGEGAVMTGSRDSYSWEGSYEGGGLDAWFSTIGCIQLGHAWFVCRANNRTMMSHINQSLYLVTLLSPACMSC
jgi:hypothetical protein